MKHRITFDKRFVLDDHDLGFGVEMPKEGKEEAFQFICFSISLDELTHYTTGFNLSLIFLRAKSADILAGGRRFNVYQSRFRDCAFKNSDSCE